MKFKSLCPLFLIFILTSCASRQPKIVNKIIRDTVVINKITEKYESVRMANLDKYKISSSYYPAVGQDERVRFLVLHYTALDNEKSLNVLTTQQVSAHYLVPNDFSDSIYILVDETKRSWHAGQSYWKGINNINFSSIGIEIVNEGYYVGEITENNPTGWYFYGYPNMQIKKVAELAKNIIDRYKIDPVNVLAHSDVAPQRKQDPGPKFPWKQLYQDYGIGAWYEDAHKNIYLPKFPYDQIDDFEFIQTVQNDLNIYGYEIQKTGVWDDQTKKVIMAFQYHFRPERCDGVMDAESWAILQSLILKYRN
ncbi:MAG: N-acetylmuramoyl-L-alanine amidase [Weeksellaceae bacterium]